MFAGLSVETDVGRIEEVVFARHDPFSQLGPRLSVQIHSKVRDRDLLTVEIGAKGVEDMRIVRRRDMKDDMVTIEVEVDEVGR